MTLVEPESINQSELIILNIPLFEAKVDSAAGRKVGKVWGQ